MALLLLSPANAAAQRGGGHGGGHGGGGGGGQPSGPSGGHGGGPSGGGGGPSNGHGGGYPGGGYHPYYGGGYRGYYGGYHPYYYSPYFSNGFYASFYYGLGYYPYYWNFAYGYPGYYGAYGGYGAYGAYGGYPCCGYPNAAYAYGGWSTARLEMKPREAQVFVDGYYVGTINDFDGVFQRLDIPVGQHELSVYLPGYQTWSQQVLFRPGESYHYKGDLQAAAPGAPQDPRPVPNPNAQNNAPQEYGPPPNEPGYGDPNGQHGYPPQSNGNPNGGMYPYPPQAGEPGRLPPMPEGRTGGNPAAGFGTLNLRVQPGDAVVQIDGEKWDNPDGGSRLVVQLAAGPHQIEVRKDGYRPYSTTIQIHAGEPQTINVVLPQGY
jgi:hypothetical protein